MPTVDYDIFGDIHGCNLTLEALLQKLGYQLVDGHYAHPQRQAIFLGDFIDRGPGQKEVIDLVKGMMEAGSAHAVMGNHELNAIAYYTQNPLTGDFLRPHTEKNRLQHEVFLDVFERDEVEWKKAIDWFKTLPLWLDLGEIRCIHACWDDIFIEKIKKSQNDSNLLGSNLLNNGFEQGNWEFEALETLLKGKEIPLPTGHHFFDKQGIKRHNMRVRWWDSTATNYRAAYLGPENARTHIPDDDIIGDHLVDYGHSMPPVFIGHYWLEGNPEPLAGNIACLDYSVAKPGGKLTVYRWSGEKVLRTENFVSVNRVEA